MDNAYSAKQLTKRLTHYQDAITECKKEVLAMDKPWGSPKSYAEVAADSIKPPKRDKELKKKGELVGELNYKINSNLPRVIASKISIIV